MNEGLMRKKSTCLHVLDVVSCMSQSHEFHSGHGNFASFISRSRSLIFVRLHRIEETKLPKEQSDEVQSERVLQHQPWIEIWPNTLSYPHETTKSQTVSYQIHCIERSKDLKIITINSIPSSANNSRENFL